MSVLTPREETQVPSKPTPGPWEEDTYVDASGSGLMLLGRGGKGRYVCHVYMTPTAKTATTTAKWRTEREANLRLIKAAPDLRDALGGALDDFAFREGIDVEDVPDWVRSARAALSKSGG